MAGRVLMLINQRGRNIFYRKRELFVDWPGHTFQLPTVSLGHSSKGYLDFLHDTLLLGAGFGAVFFAGPEE
jgi:hypothetical protein